jgi:hypothetical protein
MTRKRKPIVTYGKRARGRPQRRLSLSSDGVEMFFPNSNEIDTSQQPPPLPPKKFTSQKAASMPAEPEDEKIETFTSVTDAPRAIAIRYLKVN